jgi:hypothetical protein
MLELSDWSAASHSDLPESHAQYENLEQATTSVFKASRL